MAKNNAIYLQTNGLPIMKYFVLFSCLLCLLACGPSKVKDGKPQTDNYSFVKTYEGNVGNYPIMMKLEVYNNSISGSYFYKSQGIEISLTGQLKSDNTFLINELDNYNTTQAVFRGEMDSNKALIGSWSKSGSQSELNFRLIESNTLYEALLIQIGESVVKKLEGRYESPFNSGGISFGMVEFKYLGGRNLQFNISTAHESGCTGNASGTISVSNNRGEYSGENCKSIVFIFKKNKITIDEKDCELHGMRCYFSGDYNKI